jgi:hypothetical protein
MTVGLFNTALFTQDLAKKSFAGMITRLMPNGAAPLFGLTAMLAAETALQMEHGFFTKTMVFPSFTCTAAGQLSTDVIFTGVNTANLLPGMILRVDTTGENVIVNSVLGPTQISVQRSVGTIAAAAIGASVALYMVGNAYEEASLRPTALAINPVRITNYTQIFRNTWALADSVRATQMIAGDTNVAENRQDCAGFHAADIEKALFWGQKYVGSRNGQSFHTMDGLINIITANAAANVTTLGATTNYTQIEAALDPCFNVATNPQVANERLLFVGGTAHRVLNNIGRLNGTYFITDGQTSYGLQFGTLKIARGTFRIIEHPLFNAFGPTTTWAKMAVAVDLTTFNLAYLGDRKTQNREFNTDGDMEAQDNGIDAVGGTLTTEVTCLVKNPPANAVLYNFTAAAVG